MSFPNDHTNSWPEPSSQPISGWRKLPQNPPVRRRPLQNSSNSLFPASQSQSPGAQLSQGSHLSLQPNPQAEAIQRMEGLLRSNKTKMDQIESHILTKDKKLDVIRDDMEKLRKVVMSTDKRTMKLVAPVLDKIFDQVREGNLQIRQEAAAANSTVHRVEDSLQVTAKNTTEMTGDLTAMKTQSGEVKHAFESMLNELREVKGGMQSVSSESVVMKNAMNSLVNETKEVKNVIQPGAHAAQEIFNTELASMKNGLQSVMNETKEIKNVLQIGAEATMKNGLQSIVNVTKEIKDFLHAGMEATQATLIKGLGPMKNELQSITAETQRIKNGIISVTNDSELGMKRTEEIKNGIRSIMNESRGLKKECRDMTDGIQSVKKGTEEMKNEIFSAKNESRETKKGVLSLKKDTQGIKQDANQIKNEMQSVLKESKKGMQEMKKEIEEMHLNVLRLLELKIDSDTSKSMDTSDGLFASESNSTDRGQSDASGSQLAGAADASQRPDSAEDSLFSPQSAFDATAAEVNQVIGENGDMKDDDSLFSPQSARVETPVSSAPPSSANNIMDHSAFASALASRGTRGGFGARWEPQTDDDDSLFTERMVEKNKASKLRRKWR